MSGFDIRGRAVACGLSLIAAAVAACIPAPSDRAGSIPPPEIDDDIPIADRPPIDNGNGVPDTTQVFDVTVSGSSLTLTGITVDATLTVERDAGATGDVPRFVELRDVENTFNGANTVGVSGGILLTTSETLGSGVERPFYNLVRQGDGSVTATFIGSVVSISDENLFILQDGGTTFEPGTIGITYEVDAGSQFTFRIEGNSVSGTFDLNGTPISDAGAAETYTGTFSGTLRP